MSWGPSNQIWHQYLLRCSGWGAYPSKVGQEDVLARAGGCVVVLTLSRAQESAGSCGSSDYHLESLE